MAHYFFDLSDGTEIVKDQVGLELIDLPAARECAMALALSELSGRRQAPNLFDAREMQVRLSAGRRVAKIALRYVSP